MPCARMSLSGSVRPCADRRAISSTPWPSGPSASWTPLPGGGWPTCYGPQPMEPGPASPPPQGRRWPLRDCGGRGRVLPDPDLAARMPSPSAVRTFFAIFKAARRAARAAASAASLALPLRRAGRRSAGAKTQHLFLGRYDTETFTGSPARRPGPRRGSLPLRHCPRSPEPVKVVRPRFAAGAPP
jgi:hypothetical protein